MHHSTPARITVLAAAAAVASAMVGAGFGGAKAADGPTLRMGAGYGVDSLNPFVGFNSLDAMTYRVLYPFLLQYDNANKLTTAWAESYTVSDGGKSWRFTTPAGVKWSDGQPLSTGDAAWTINTMLKLQKGAAALYAPYLSNMTGASAPSPTTLVVTFSRPTSTAGYGLANVPILPKHVWAQYAAGTGARLRQFANTSPVSAGPFLLTSYANKQKVLFAANPDYWGKRPKIGGFGIVSYSSFDALVSALETNSLDVVLGVPPTVVKRLKSNQSLKVESAFNYDVSMLWINSSAKRTTHPELRNPQLRNALMLGINRKAMSNTLNLGYGATGSSILAPNQPNVDKSLPPPRYDPAAANRILDRLGFKRGQGGIRVAEGHPMRYVLRISNVTSGAPQNGQMFVADLKKLGIAVTTLTSDYPGYLAAIHSANYTKFDFAIDDNNPTFDPSQFMSILTCAQIGSQNDGAYCNSSYDKLYEKQLKQFGAARQSTLNAMQRLIYNDKPTIPLFWNANVFALRKTVQGFPPTPLPTIDYESTQWLENVTVG